MDRRLLVGWALNAIWLLHLVFKNKSGRLSKAIAILLLTIPYLGFIFYFIFYVWDVPPPQPLYMRQNRPNHYGKTEFGASDNQFDVEGSLNDVRGIRKLVKRKFSIHIGIVLIGLVIILFGLMSTIGPGGSYLNWWGGPVFGPAAIFIGILFLYVMTKAPRKEKR
jgi:fatty acid desaturase